jgi:capsular polysaccharide biosynthesis protein
VLEPTYESNTILLVSNASANLANANSSLTGVEGLMNTLSGNIPQTIATYKEQMLTTDMMSRVIQRLNLQDEYTPVSLRKVIAVNNVTDTNLLDVKVTSGEPELSALIANTLAEVYMEFVADMNTQRLSKSSEFLSQKVEEEKAKLDAALEVYKEFLAQSPGPSEIQAEISFKSARLNGLKSELDTLSVNYERDILNVENSILLKEKENSNVDALLNETDQFIVQNQSVLQDNTATAIAQAEGENGDSLLGLVLENEVLNSNYVKLISQSNGLKIELENLNQKKMNLKTTFDKTKALIEKEIVKLSDDLESLNVTYAEKSNEEKLIKKDVARAESSYDQFVKSYEESRVAESADIGKYTILVNSKAVVNDKPVGPRKVLNMAIAAVLGCMISVFYVFFKHYWNEAA